ncbi:MAG: hypothetical protein R3Y60_04020 [bacterium]
MYSQYQYGIYHFLFLLVFVLIFVLSLLFCKSESRKEKLLFVVAIITFLLTTATRFTYENASLFPGTLCSLVGMLFPILLLFQKNKKENPIINTCVFSGILGGVLVAVSGNAFNTEITIYNIIINMSYHFCIFFLGILVILSKRTTLKIKYNIYVILCYVVLLISSFILKGQLDLYFDYLYFYLLGPTIWIILASVVVMLFYLTSYLMNKKLSK